MKSCPLCKSKTEDGVILSAVWHPGTFENGRLRVPELESTKKDGKKGLFATMNPDLRMLITAYRCTECSYLSCYAEQKV